MLNITDFYNGRSFDAYKYFGAHPTDDGCVFRVYAPRAKRVTVTGDFNDWGETELVRGEYAFSAEIKGARPGMMYKYKIYSALGCVDHCDPYGFGMELRPGFASVIRDIGFEFGDDEWMRTRSTAYDSPVNIYELHLGAWRTNEDGSPRGYAEIAEELADYLVEKGYTHAELMPISEHPADISWGYQNTGFFAPTSRYGTAEELARFVDILHGRGIGVILDFVPIHFAVDSYGLEKFDGEALYEYPDDDMGKSEWGSYNFNFGKGEVRSFLLSAADYWLSEYHFDGLRIDAVSRAIFWLGNAARGVNDRAIEFMQTLNSGLKQRHRGIMMIAEDSTNYLKVTAPVEYDGLGFDYKWDMGWMNDTLEFFRMPPEYRDANMNKLRFSMAYFYNELYILPLSHDENVHGKATIIQKMWGDYEQKFPQARLLYLYMYTHPGKKLNFMGGEFAQFREWDEKRGQDWMLFGYPKHDRFARFVRDLSRVYKYSEPLYNGEYNSACFRSYDTEAPGTLVYTRGNTEKMLVCMNFLDVDVRGARIELEGEYSLELVINSDNEIYGGDTRDGNTGLSCMAQNGRTMIELKLPPFSGQILRLNKA